MRSGSWRNSNSGWLAARRLNRVLVPLGVLFWVSPATAAVECVALEGDLAQGGLAWAQVAPGARVELDARAVDVLPDGHFVIGFSRDAPAQSVLVIDEESRCEQTLDIAARDYRIDRVEGVPQRTVRPPKEQLERIRREREKVRAAKDRRIARPDWLMQVAGGFQWPATGRISGVYGSQRFYNGEPGSPHYGVDVAVPTGTPVYAPAAGLVTLAEDDLFYSGGTVILDHGYYLSSSFLHMSRVLVSVGDEVEPGDIIGEVGATGRATGPHLDWRMSWRNARVDPQRLVPPMPTP
jgi:murein DD-endopeptidase MepM/ murein hydrolase activator NlpD